MENYPSAKDRSNGIIQPSSLVQISSTFNWRQELNSSIGQVRRIMPIKPICASIINFDEQIKLNQWYYTVKTTVDFAKQEYLGKLETAVRIGGLNAFDFDEALSCLKPNSPFNEFEKILERAKKYLP